MPECFAVSETDKVAHIRLCRPDELNTMTPAFWRELPEIVNAISDAGTARTIVISSTGRHFSAGMDLAVFAAGGAGARDDTRLEAGRRHADTRMSVLALQEALTCLERARMPVLAAIQGGCVGGAVDLVTACDLRYCTADAFFVVQEINIAMTADVGTLQRLPKLIPHGVAREYAYTGRRMPAPRAAELGLVNAVFDDHDDLLAGVMDVAAEIAAKSPLAIWGSKEMLNHARDHPVADGLERIATWQAAMFQPTDLLEALAARTEGRQPVFDDLAPLGEPLA